MRPDSIFSIYYQVRDSWVIVPYAFLAHIPGNGFGSVTSAEVACNNPYLSVPFLYYFILVYGLSEWPHGMSVCLSLVSVVCC